MKIKKMTIPFFTYKNKLTLDVIIENYDYGSSVTQDLIELIEENNGEWNPMYHEAYFNKEEDRANFVILATMRFM